jgi:hypothetical protein
MAILSRAHRDAGAFLLPILLLALIAGGLLIPASAAIADDLPHVRCDGRRLMFGWHGGSPHRVDVSNLIRAVTLDSARVLTAQRDGDIDYFVVCVTGPSSGADPGASNAAGTETNLLWLKLKSWKLLDAQSTLYQSYFDSLDPIGDYHLKGGVLTLRFVNRRESTDYVLHYDCSHPEDKIAISRAGDVE